MRTGGAPDERHLSVVRDGVPRRSVQGPGGGGGGPGAGLHARRFGEFRVPDAPPAPRAPAAPAAAPPPAAPAGAAPGQRMSGPLRPVNPFMVQDPKQKARRLARALVSDLVVYHPEKRQQGLRDGTLPQLFKDEIEKSWQAYLEQVGVGLA